MVAGALISYALGFLVCVGLTLSWRPDTEKIAAELQPPKFPDASPVSAYEQAGRWSLITLEGAEVSLSQFKGKVVFLNFWATYCRPCVAEMPNIQNLYDFLKEDEVVFLLASHEKKETVQKFIKKNPHTFPVYIYDPEGLSDFFSLQNIPTTVILDRQGMVVCEYRGAAKWDDESCISFIRALL
jgi:thiol-disulfide isomerase/thioredoxin